MSYRNILYLIVLSISIINFLCLYTIKLILTLIVIILIKTIIRLRLWLESIFMLFWFCNILTHAIIRLVISLLLRLLIGIWLETLYIIWVVILLIIISLKLLRIIVLILWRIIRLIITKHIIYWYFLSRKSIEWILRSIVVLWRNILILHWLCTLIILLLIRYKTSWIGI